MPERKSTPRSYPYGGLYKALGASEEDKEVYQVCSKKNNSYIYLYLYIYTNKYFFLIINFIIGSCR